jgi:transposase-like protein
MPYDSADVWNTAMVVAHSGRSGTVDDMAHETHEATSEETDTRLAVIAMVVAGGRLKHAAELHGVSAVLAREWLREAGVNLPQGGLAKTEARVAAVADVRAGTSYRQSAVEAGVSEASVRNWCRADGVQNPGRAIPLPEAREIVLSLIRAGQSVSAAASAAGVNAASVRKWCRGEVRIPSSAHPTETRARALEMVRGGEMCAEVGRTLGLAPGLVRRWCTQAGQTAETRRGPRKHADDMEAGILERLRAGDGHPTITVEFGVSSASIRRIAKAAGIVMARGTPKKAIKTRDLDELDRRVEELLVAGALAARTRIEDGYMVDGFQLWCVEHSAGPLLPTSHGAYLLYQARHGRSGRDADRGAATGWCVATLNRAAVALSRWVVSEGAEPSRDTAVVKNALAEARRIAPDSPGGRRRIENEEIGLLAQVPMPDPSWIGLRVRALVHLVTEAHLTPDSARRLLRGPPALVSITHTRVTAEVDGTSVRLVHRPGGVLGCAHCAVRALQVRAVAEGHTRLEGPAGHLPQEWSAAARRAGMPDLAVPAPDELVRFMWHADLGQLRWLRRQTVNGLLSATGWRVSEVTSLDLDGVAAEPDPPSRWMLTCEARKNDRYKRGLDVPLDEEHAPVALGLLRTWMFVRGGTPGALFPGRGTAAHLSTDAAREGLNWLALEAGVSTDRLGPHGFRHASISRVLERGVDIFLTAGRFGITAETAMYYFEQASFSVNVSDELGLGDGS